MRRVVFLPCLVLVGLLIGLSEARAYNGEVVLRGGITEPHGSLQRYVDTSFALSLKGVYRLPRANAFGIWLEVGFIPFRNQDRIISYNREGYANQGKLVTSENAFNLMIGGLFGSSSRNSFFRPHVSAGIGLYWFTTDNYLEVWEFDADTLEEIHDNTDTRIRPGTELTIGAALFPVRKFGVGLDLTYDFVFNLRQPDPLREESSNVKFTRISLTLVFQFDSYTD